MPTTEDSQIIADFCKANLDLQNASLSDEYYYASLPLCVIDAVFSLAAHYSSTRNTVIRFCDHFRLKRIGGMGRLQEPDQFTITDFIKLYESCGPARMASEVYRNRQRTSSRNGILKSEAVLRFSRVLQRNAVNDLRGMDKLIGDPNFEREINRIPGQTTGISLRYFYMLAGSDHYIKPDRMIRRFIHSALGRTLGVEDSHEAIVGAHKILLQEYPHLTLRLLDHLIWNYQRTRQ